MQSQGNHVPQYSSNSAPLPPPSQAATPAPSLTTPHGPAAPLPTPTPALPPPPPPYQQLPFRPVSHQGHSFPPPAIHHARPNLPPPNQMSKMGLSHSGHIPPSEMANAGQPYLISHSSSHGHAALQYAPSYNAYGIRQSVLYHSTGLPIPPPPRSQIPYGVQPVHGQTGVMQRMAPPPLPPPPTAGFSPITPSHHASFLHAPITGSHSPSMLPPLPPPPASPPPLPPSPPPSSSSLPDASSSYSALDTIRQSETVKVLTEHVDKITNQSMIAGATESNRAANLVEEGGVSSKLPTLMDLPSPPMKPEDDEVVRNIEVLSKFIAKVGPSFEDMARAKEAGNPKFAFLTGGEAGSMAATGYEYFQWMKRKCLMEHGECRSTPHALVPPEVESTLQSAYSINKSHVHSPSASSDIEMEDDINHPDEEQATVGELLEDVSREVPLSVKDDGLIHSPELHAPHMLKELSVIKEDHTNKGQSSSEVAASVSGYGRDTYISVGKDVSEVHVSPPFVSAHLEEVSGICTGDENPFKLIQDYASESSSEDEKALSSDDTRNMGKVDSHRNETTIICLDSNFNHVCETEEDLAGKQPMSNAHKSDPTSGTARPNSPNVAYRNGDADHNGLGELLESKAPTELKVDEFGRIIRDVTDSDSDEASYNAGRHLEKGRRDARRRSPQGNRRRKSRSPWRRRDRRSRSRSFSPRRRARSPLSLRRMHESSSEKVKRDGRHQVKECFDFLRGRCYRGSSCRYLHHDLSVGSSMKHHKDRRKQFDERSMEFESSHGCAALKDDEVENTMEGVIKHDSNLARGEAKNLQHVTAKDVSVDGIDKEKQFASFGDDKKSTSDGELTQLPNSLLAKGHALNKDENQQVNGLGSHLLENVGLPPPLEGFPEQKLPGNNHRIPLSGEKTTFELSQVNFPPVSSQMPPQDVGVPSATAESSEAAKVRPFMNQTPMSPSLPTESFGSFGDQSLVASNFQTSSSVGGFQLQPSSVPQPSSLREISFMAPPTTDLQMNSSGRQIHLQTLSADYFSSHQPPPSDFYSTYAPPKSWTNLPPPPPRMDNFSQPSRQYPPDAPPQIGGFNPLQIPDLNPKLSFNENLRDQFEGTKGGQQFTHPTIHPQHQFLPPLGLVSVSGQVPSCPVQPFPGNSSHLRPFSSEEYGTESSRDISFSSRFGGDTTENSSLSKYPPSFSDRMGLNLPRLTHYNPFASTFEQVPANCGLNSSIYRGETDSNYSSKSNFPSTSTIGYGSGQLTAPHNSNMSQVPLLPTSGRSLQMCTTGEPRGHDQGVPSAQQNKVSGSDQYDPIFDSIEPSSKKSRKLDPSHVDDSSSSLRAGSVFRSPDVEENNKQKKDGQPASINCLDKDSVGETGMDEVGALENVSQENLIDTGGEIEIDQFQSPGKSKKKSKDSKSMKLFRISIANFVKELLKPSWRQGNMSKEAFKTIVKKTVDKVSSAMQGRHVPKSQAKINQYVESSERKLTKLVMGYVDKYVKAK